MENDVFHAWHYIWKCLYRQSSMSVPNFMFISKSAQFTWNLELSRRTKNELRWNWCPKISQARVFAACAQSSTYVTTCNCIVFECFSVDRWKSIRPVVWTRIDWCVFDDNENAYFWKRAHLCVYGAKTQTVRRLRVFKSRRRKPLSSYCNRNRSCKRLETWDRLQFPEGKITRAHMYALAHRHKQLILITAWKRAFWTE